MGPGEDGDKSIRIRNRIVQWKGDTIVYEPDQRHAELIVKHLGLGSSKANASSVPGQKRAPSEGNEDNKEMEGPDATKYRALVARAMFLTQDRADIGFAVQELSRRMRKPT